MRNSLFHTASFVLSLLMLFAAGALPCVGAEPPPGFKSLFNGKDLSGWHGMPDFSLYTLAALPATERKAKIDAWTATTKQHWKVEGDELVNDGQGAFLTTDKNYGDIELLVEYKTVPLADSGIYLRGTPQVQIWDYTKAGGKWNLGADKGSGGLWNNSPGSAGKDPLVLADKPFGQWNKFRIIMVGERVTVYLNDKLVVDNARLENYWRSTVHPPKYNRATPLMKTGPIQLQTHGGEIRWRNLFVREIPSAEANEILRKHNNEGFVSVFNGKDLTGWAGPVDEYQVVDGAVLCRPNKGGTIYTKTDYKDFVARVEFKLPPAGNNGLAIRYPGYGDGAYVGTCECQILDDTAHVYDHLDPRQYCASAYGMTAVNRGYLRPVGEWNFIEVTAVGPKLKMELNGTLVTDTDLSQVKEYMHNSPHPGKLLTHGHFGFCGHDDPVAFRNVEIKELNPKISESRGSINERDATRKPGVGRGSKLALVYKVDEKKTDWRPEKMYALLDAISRRLNPTGRENIAVKDVGGNMVQITMPAPSGTSADKLAQIEEIQRRVRTTGFLEFRIVASRRFNQSLIERAAQARKEACRKSPGTDNARFVYSDKPDPLTGKPKEVAKWCRVRGSETEPLRHDDAAIEVDDGKDANGEAKRCVELLVLASESNATDVTGQFIREMRPAGNAITGAWGSDITFNAEGGKRFARLTGEHLPLDNGAFKFKLAIVLDDVVLTAPELQGPIAERARIAGDFSHSQIQELCDIVNAGALPAALEQKPVREIIIEGDAPAER